MKTIRMLLVAGLLTAGLTACADYYDGYGPYGYDYDYGYHHHRDMYWEGGHRYCRSLSDPDEYYTCDPY